MNETTWKDIIIYSFLIFVCIILAATCSQVGFCYDNIQESAIENIMPAIAMQESSCNASITGDKNNINDKSLGLFQVKWSTAKDYDKKIKRKDLFDARINYKFARLHLLNLYARYNGNLIHTLDAYNRGQKQVDKCSHKHKRSVYIKKHPYAFQVIHRYLTDDVCKLDK